MCVNIRQSLHDIDKGKLISIFITLLFSRKDAENPTFYISENYPVYFRRLKIRKMELELLKVRFPDDPLVNTCGNLVNG